jgi:uncharacterized membrane protein (UPF0136 family)
MNAVTIHMLKKGRFAMNGTPVPTTHLIAIAIIALYGIVSLAGGIVGYVRADSVASLVAGGIAGILLLLCAAGVFYYPAVSLSGAIIIAAALLSRFAPDLIRHRDGLSDFLSTMKGIVALIMVIDGLLVILFSVLALATRAKPPGAA